MATTVCSLLLLFFISMALMCVDAAREKEKYIVYMGDLPLHSVDVRNTHHELLSEALGSHDAAKESHVHSYTQSLNGFVATLTKEEADKLKDMDGVVSVFKSKTLKLHTTRSWDFLGFPHHVKRNHAVESNIIVGVIDSGITIESESFSDKGFGPPPAKWKGSCGPFSNFTCNNKIIGAKVFRVDKKVPAPDVLSPVDYRGHGTHTASTIAGGLVKRANFFGLAYGTARGAVPSARIAVYKVCYIDGQCNDDDILAAFDAAIADGVDIINLSVGEDPGFSLTDTLAIGSYHAMKRGILTSASAGNDGPMHRTVVNYSPWMMTVGSSTIDRQFVTKVMLGNGMNLTGISVNTFEMEQPMYPIISGADASAAAGGSMMASRCVENSLDPARVKGKIVFCQATGGAGDADIAVKAAGGVGVVAQISSLIDTPDLYVLPVTILNKTDGKIALNYIKSHPNGKAVIFKSTEDFTVKAPAVASYSARGPNPAYRSILKPDLVAPGNEVLAASTPKTSVTQNPDDTRFSKYLVRSGTSMASPFAAGAAAYVKTFHPRWSPAAIKSALMTTARVMNSNATSAKDGEYAYGAGQIDPQRAVDPGLVYDANEVSYISFLCKELTNMTAINILTGLNSTNCSAYPRARGQDGLNYPSMQYIVEDSTKPSAVEFYRMVTNVGNGSAVYTATVNAAAGLQVSVWPSTLTFSRLYEKKTFKVTVKTQAMADPPYALSSSLVWSDKVHAVRSPIVVHFT